MVMDATQPQQPSPQSVGREFVRQYYTLLNKAPTHLHRFYNHNSSFIHGESTLVVGQKNIHNHIQQLNFRDCHAKISQVDAQATLGNGVVVQVTGELSNDGQPMRRFTQTFVLAAQSPKKYYVHNDIFRYQDLYSDEENDGESRSENDEELHEQQAVMTINEQQQQQQQQASSQVGSSIEQSTQPQPQQSLPSQVVTSAGAGGTGVIAQAAAPQQQAPIYYSLPTGDGRTVQVLAAHRSTGVPLPTQFAAGAGVPPPPQVQAAAVTPQLNGVVAHDDMINAVAAAAVVAAGMQQPQQPLVVQAGAPNVVQPVTVSMPVATPVIAQTAATTISITNATGLPPNAAGIVAAGGFQQTPLVPQVQQQLLQQQQQQQPNQQTNLMQQQTQQTVAVTNSNSVGSNNNNNNNDDDDMGRNSNAVVSHLNDNVTSTASVEVTATPIVDDFKSINEQQQQEKYEAEKQQQNEPKTYANLFKSSSSSPSGFVNTVMQHHHIQQQQQQQQSSANNTYQHSSSSSISTATFSQSISNSSNTAYNNRNDNSNLRMDNSNHCQPPMPQRTNTRMNKDYDDRRGNNMQQFSDNHQLFFGNVPHHASEEELKALFSRFGSVLELRIISKPSTKVMTPGVRNPLNYGFITYEDPESVQNCLANCPLYFPENSPDAQKLNVEEKRPRLRPNDMPSRQSIGNNMNNNMGNSQRNNMGGGPSSRSLSNSGMMRNNSGGNNMQRGSNGGPRMGGGFNRNDNRGGPPNNGPQNRGGNSGNNSHSGGGNYGGRR